MSEMLTTTQTAKTTITYRVTFTKTFETGVLVGLTVPASISFTYWADAASWIRKAQREPRMNDVLSNNRSVRGDFQLLSVWPDGTTRTEMA